MADMYSEISFCGDPPAAAQDYHLADRRELALVAVERTRMPMVVTDPRQHDNPIVLANQAFLDLTGYCADEIIGRNCRFLQGPQTAPENIADIREALSSSTEHFEIDMLNYRKDGTTFWNQLSISPVYNRRGELLYHFASQMDITARLRAEELEHTERRLLMEVDHRAMNALALVQSIVSLSTADTVQGLARSIYGRVDAIARAHRLLSQSGWVGSDILQLVEGQMPDHLGTRIELRGQQMLLLAPIVQPLSLVLHELVSNAMAHGALSDNVGRVALSWHEQDETLHLRWSEKGPALQDAYIKEKFGLEIVRNVIEQQLSGRLKIEITPGELIALFSLPLAVRQWSAAAE